MAAIERRSGKDRHKCYKQGFAALDVQTAGSAGRARTAENPRQPEKKTAQDNKTYK